MRKVFNRVATAWVWSVAFLGHLALCVHVFLLPGGESFFISLLATVAVYLLGYFSAEDY